MNTTAKIIITDTNVITDLNNAGLLEKFIALANVYVSDLVMNCLLYTSLINVMSKICHYPNKKMSSPLIFFIN